MSGDPIELYAQSVDSASLLVRALRWLRGIAATGPSTPVVIPTANTLWVSKTGDDATAVRGNEAKPFLTVGAALLAMQEGDLVYVYPGVYSETVTPPGNIVNGTLAGAGRGVTKLNGLIYGPTGTDQLFSVSGINFSTGGNCNGSSAVRASLALEDVAFGFGLTLGAFLRVDGENVRFPGGPLQIVSCSRVNMIDVDAQGMALGWDRSTAGALLRDSYVFNNVRLRAALTITGEPMIVATNTVIESGGCTMTLSTYKDITYDECANVALAARITGNTVISFAKHQAGQTSQSKVNMTGSVCNGNVSASVTAAPDPVKTSLFIANQFAFVATGQKIAIKRSVAGNTRGSGLRNNQINGGDTIGTVDREFWSEPGVSASSLGVGINFDPPFPDTTDMTFSLTYNANGSGTPPDTAWVDSYTNNGVLLKSTVPTVINLDLTVFYNKRV